MAGGDGKLLGVLAGRRTGDDPVARLRERLEHQHEAGDTVDLDAEIEELEKQGFAWPSPLTDELEEIHAAVRAVGLDGAMRLGVLDFERLEPWEVEFVTDGLRVLAATDRNADRRFLMNVLGVKE